MNETGRLIALDISRSIAVLGMIIVNVGPHQLDGTPSLVIRSAYGRASILFIVVAGIAISLLMKRQRSRPNAAAMLIWRALLLLLLGLLLQRLPHQANVILALYALLFLLALLLLLLPTRGLLILTLTWTITGPLAWILIHVSGSPVTNVEPAALGHQPTEIITSVLFTGPYPLIVWAAPFIFGLWLGRMELSRVMVQRRLILFGAGTAIGALLCANALVSRIGEPNLSRVGFDWLVTAYGHSQMPLWLISSVGMAAALIGILLIITPLLGASARLVAAIGQIPLTAYVTHLLALSWFEPPTTTLGGLGISSVLYSLLVVFALFWRKISTRGPLETVLSQPMSWLAAPKSSAHVDAPTSHVPVTITTTKWSTPTMRTASVLSITTTATVLAIVLSSCGIVDQESPPAPEGPAPGTPTDETPSAPLGEATNSAESELEETVLNQAGVSAGHPLAAEAGERILEQGGNAVDAAIAAAFAVSVVEPFASGIGGGGSAIIVGPGEDPRFYDYREVVNDAGIIPDSNVGIPGFVAGMGQLHQEHGDLDWSSILQPAYELASEGFNVSEFLAERMQQSEGTAAVSQIEHFAPGGQPLAAGQTLVQEDLAATINTLSENDWEDYYTGSLSESLVDGADGIDAGSLADYEVVAAEPVRGDFGEYELLGAAPALPGAPMIQMLQIAEAQGITDMDPGSAEYVDTLSRAWLVAEDSVLTQLGDPDFVSVPVEELTDRESNAAIGLGSSAQSIQATGGRTDAPNTTHVSVVDREGLTVSMTNTLLSFWGSGQLIDGYFLNNHLSRFETIPSDLNQPEPGRRTVTWSNPVLVLDDAGLPVMAIGSPGGHQILNILGTVLVQWGLQERNLQDSITAPRFRAEGSTLYLEQGHPSELVSELENLGWNTQVWPDELATFGSVQMVEADYGARTINSADDPRRDGAHRILDW
ncbi:gamma-glutamyltransferase [Nesterenkonia haasae]|uniref:gamma-glutamyltransferase n=1 Tax=Nesterenkonia haasae TaxID=2587813 RepID=UPI0013910372|nr:gamma-glutamyltransferase [Nesterenkonia haasae]